jgi:hypothetical protein
MIVKVFTKIGSLYIKIHEEEISINEIERVLKEWLNADLVEIFDNDRLVFVHVNN